MKALFDTILLPQFSINKSPPTGGMYYEYYVSKKDEDEKSENNEAGNAPPNNRVNDDIDPGDIGDEIGPRNSGGFMMAINGSY